MNATLNILIPILVPAIGSVLAALIGLAAAHLRAKTRSLEMRDAITMTEQTVTDVVAELQHTVVEPLKREDVPYDLAMKDRQNWTPEAAGIVKARAVQTVVQHLGQHMMSVLKRELSGDVQQWIATKVEAEVARNK